jgi:hypothetical protein
MKIGEGIHGQLIGIFKTLFSCPFCLKNLLTGMAQYFFEPPSKFA